MSVVGWLANVFNSAVNKYTGAGLTGAERQAHDLNVSETMRQERRQEDFYNQYQSIGAQVRQMDEAGINPAVAAGGLQAVSPASGPSASPASAAPGGDPIQAILGTIEGIRSLKYRSAEEKRKQEAHDKGIERQDAEIRNLNARSASQEFENLHQEELFELDRDERNARIEQIFASVDKTEADAALARVNTDLATLEKQYQEYSNALAALDVKYREPLLQAQLAKTQAETNYIKYKQELDDARLLLDNANSESERQLIGKRVALLEKQIEIASEESRVAGEMQDAALEKAKGDANFSKHQTTLETANTIIKGVATVAGATLGVFKGGNHISKANTKIVRGGMSSRRGR